MEIKDRVFIVTGASSGIGLSTAIALSDRGAKVALLARSTDALKELAQKLPGSLPFTVDMTQFDRVREAVSACTRFIALFHSRGGFRRPVDARTIKSGWSTMVSGVSRSLELSIASARRAASWPIRSLC
jgi:NADP-dependent 3-hydroxy acid dehydrogenase YdfG